MSELFKDSGPTLWEAGHYYSKKGPTHWSVKGWELMETLKKTADATLLFIDDIHPVEVLHPHEQEAPVVGFQPVADHTVLESHMIHTALNVLQELKGLSSKKRAKQAGNGTWFLSNFPLTHPDGRPLCVLLDAALSVYKSELGFQQAVNVLPAHYQGQQDQLHKIISRILPEFNLKTLFFNLGGGLEIPVAFKNPQS